MPGTLTDGYVARCRLVDTGCAYDLISASELQVCDMIRKADEGVILANANGEVCVDEVVDMQIGPLGEVSLPYVKQKAHPSVVGRDQVHITRVRLPLAPLV